MGKNCDATEQAMNSLTQLQELIHKKYNIDPATLDPEASMLEQGIDSLALADFLFDVEDHFGIDIPAERTDINSLAGLARAIDDVLAARDAGKGG
jgi:acyl carrier protein